MFTIIENKQEEKDRYHNDWWGAEDLIIGAEELQALLSGKTLAFNDGEYSHTLTLSKELLEGK